MSLALAHRPASPSPAQPAPRSAEPAAVNPVWQRLAMRDGALRAASGAADPSAPLRRAPVDRAEAPKREEHELARTLPPLVGGGAPLSPRQRDYFEPRFGRDLGRVRVHTGAHASQAAHSVGARAFTTGTDVVFAEGQYAPDTGAGTRLLAHELTHVLQQTGPSERAPTPPRGAAAAAASRAPAAGANVTAPRTTSIAGPLGSYVARDPSCTSCTVCGSARRFTEGIATLDKDQVGTPYADMEAHIRGFLNGTSIRQDAQLTAPQRSAAGAFKYTNAPAPGMPAGKFTAGNFLFFADWQICDNTMNPCVLRQSEKITTKRTNQSAPVVTNNPAKTPRLGNSWTKAGRKTPAGNCNKTLVWVDAPGDIAHTGGSPATGFDEKVEQTIEILDGGTGIVVDTQKVTVQVGVDPSGTLSHTP